MAEKKIRGNPNRAKPPKVIPLKQLSTSREVVPYKGPKQSRSSSKFSVWDSNKPQSDTPKPRAAANGPKLKTERVSPIKFPKESTATTAAKKVASYGLKKAISRVTGPIGLISDMTSPAGAGSDKPSGPLMKGNASNPPSRSVKKPAVGTKINVGSVRGGKPQPKDPVQDAAPKPLNLPSLSRPEYESRGKKPFVPRPKPKEAGPAKPVPGAGLSSPWVPDGAKKPAPKSFSKGSTKPAYQPEGQVEKRDAVTSTTMTKMTSYQKSQARMFEKEGYGGKSLTRDQAKSMALTPAKKRKI
jgi:hypothetical protein